MLLRLSCDGIKKMYVEIDTILNGDAYDWVRLELKIPLRMIYAYTPKLSIGKTLWWFKHEEDATAFKLKWG